MATVPRCLLLLALLPIVCFTTSGADPICCMPPVLNGSLSIITGQVSNGQFVKTKITERLNADFKLKKLSAIGSISNETTHGGSLADFHTLIFADVAYSINDRMQTCTKKDIPFPELFCIPDYATKKGQVVYGMGQSSFLADDYKFHSHEATVMADNCLPVNTLATHAGADSFSMEVMVVNDVQLHVDERSFEVPSFCKQAVREEEENNFLSEILARHFKNFL